MPGILGVAGTRPALAAARQCLRLAVEADTDVRSRWPELPERVRQAFDARDDIDPCAHVKLALDAAIVIEVDLPDGRIASRTVLRPEDVVPTLQALLLVPQQQKTSHNPEPSSPSSLDTTAKPKPNAPATPAHVAAASAGSTSSDQIASTRPPAAQSSRLQVELSGFAGVRVGSDRAGLGLGALSLLDITGWLVGFEGRADRYRRISGSPFGAAVELAALGGRRFRFGTLALDFFAGPAVAMQGTSTYVTVSGPSATPVSQSSTSTVPRLLLNTRLNFGVRSTVRTFIGLDVDFGPSRADGAELPNDAPRLPVYLVLLFASVPSRPRTPQLDIRYVWPTQQQFDKLEADGVSVCPQDLVVSFDFDRVAGVREGATTLPRHYNYGASSATRCWCTIRCGWWKPQCRMRLFMRYLRPKMFR